MPEDTDDGHVTTMDGDSAAVAPSKSSEWYQPVDLAEWTRDLDSHPAFATGVDGELSTAMEAMQAMKYDDDDDTAEEKASRFKTEGNKSFELKKYRWAVDHYTCGLQQRSSDKALMAQLYGNRAAAHLRLGNVRSAAKDCFAACRLDPGYVKARIRGAVCFMKLKEFGLATEWATHALSAEEVSEADRLKMEKLKEEATERMKFTERDRRKQEMDQRRKYGGQLALLRALKERNFRLVGLELSKLEERCSDEQFISDAAELLEVDLNGKTVCVSLLHKSLIWPVMFMYPHYHQTDFVEQFREDETFGEHLATMFNRHSWPDWDAEKHEYDFDSLRVFMQSYYKPNVLLAIPLSTKLKEVMQHKHVVLQGGVPCFIVVSERTAFMPKYMERFSVIEL